MRDEALAALEAVQDVAARAQTDDLPAESEPFRAGVPLHGAPQCLREGFERFPALARLLHTVCRQNVASGAEVVYIFAGRLARSYSSERGRIQA